LILPWTSRSVASIKGVMHAPGADAVLKPETREALLTAISKARGWVDDIRFGRVGSFAEIAQHEGQGERHVRFLAPLAFVSPRIIEAIAAGSAPSDLTVTALAKSLEYSWAKQEETV
jgi:site-specific DNA recombinase